MKTLSIILCLLLGGFTLQAQNKNAKATLEVNGVCLMCKKRIEKASYKIKGVKSAVWNVETHQLNLIYDERKANLETIKSNIASIGHDIEEIKASTEAYNALHSCCKYRNEEIIEEHNPQNKKN